MAPARTFMDEVDGRPGHVALPTGQLDALKDAPKPSLCFPFLNARTSNPASSNSQIECYFLVPAIALGRMGRFSPEEASSLPRTERRSNP